MCFLGRAGEGGVRPLMFKTLVGRGHPEFATMRQQDALDFFLYLMEVLERRERAAKSAVDLGAVFRYGVEDGGWVRFWKPVHMSALCTC